MDGSARYRCILSSTVPPGICNDAKWLHTTVGMSTHSKMDTVRIGWKCAMASRTQREFQLGMASPYATEKSRRDKTFVHMINAL